MSNNVPIDNTAQNLKISAAAKYLNVSTKTLRRWEAKGLIKSNRTITGNRVYKLSDLQKVTTTPSNKKNYIAPLALTTLALCFGVVLNSGSLISKPYTLIPPTSSPAVLAASDEGITPSVAGFTFAVNVPSKFSETVTFLKDIVAPNVVNSINNETGDITIDNSLVAGSGISITNRTISNSGIVTLSAGTGISVDGNKITNTYSFTPDYTLSGWTRTGTTVGLTTITDSVTVGALTAGAVTVDSLTTGGLSLTSDLTVSSGHSLLPSVDLGSDIGSSSFRFNNLWVANINSNSSQAFSGQTTFSYPPTDTTINQASVLINPTTSIANGQLLGLAIAGYEKAVIDEDGDIILGYNSLTSAPATDYPLDIYGHSGTRVAYVDTTGNAYFGGNVGVGTSSPYSSTQMNIDGSNLAFTSNVGQLFISTNDALGANIGGSIGFGGNYAGTNRTGWASIAGRKENATSGNYSGYLSFYTRTSGSNSAERLRIDSSGNVGIGTTSPSYKLVVSRAGNGVVAQFGDEGQNSFQINNSNSSHATGTGKYVYSATNEVGMGIYDGSINFRTSLAPDLTGNIRLSINSSGNVGIGTTSPTSQFHQLFAGSGIAATPFQINYTEPTISIANAQALDFEITPVSAGRFNTTLSLGEGSDTSIHTIRAGQQPWIQYNRPSSATIFYTASTEKMRIDTSGNVGIGTTSPLDKLDVTSSFIRVSPDYGMRTVSGSHTNSIVLYNSSTGGLNITSGYSGSADGGINFASGGTTTNVRIDKSGNVGVGTTSPGAKLEIASTSNTTGLRIEYGGNGGATYGRLNIYTRGNSPAGPVIESAATDAGYQGIMFRTGSTDRVYLNSSGNVGIGTTSPGYSLDVNGTTRSTAFRLTSGYWDASTLLLPSAGAGYYRIMTSTQPLVFWTNGSSESVRIDPSGNVGIGTTSPSQKLEVAGNILFSLGSVIGGNTNLSYLNWSAAQDYASLNSAGDIYLNIDDNSNETDARALYVTADNTNNGGTKLVTIKETGNVGIGTTSPGEKLEVTGNIKTSSLTTGTVYSNNGVLTNTDPSDVNLKTNILNLPDGTLDKVLGLRTVSYDWKSTGDGALGFIAQEVQQVFPELVGTNSDGTLGLYTTQFIPLLTKAIQEQQLQIDEVKLSSASATITNEEWDGVNSLITTIQNAINEIQQKFVAMADKFRTKELCVGENGNETCVTKEQLDELLKLVPTPSTSPVVTSSPEISPEVTVVPTVSPTSVPTVEPIPTSSPSSEPIL